MPLFASSVHLDGIKTRELERRASVCSALTDSDRQCLEDDLDDELADLVPAMHQLTLEAKGTVHAWPRGQVPYTISTDLRKNHSELFEILKTAMKTFRRQITCVEWVEQESEVDFVEFVYGGNTCCSHVGCIGGRQKINLAYWAKPGNILHEMGHAIGLEHEHCRLDQDHFVKVHTKRIQEGKGHNFVIKGIPEGPYDYSSIMHYSTCAFSTGGPTIVATLAKQSESMGQREQFSELDVKGIESIYGPLKCTYEQHGEKHWPQVWFECRTCWGDASNYGCCLVCALDCHSGTGHCLVTHDLSPDAVFVCDCGRNYHQKAVCTWHSTKTEAVKQPLYYCSDCFQRPSSCCYQCMKTCHADHHITFDGILRGYCVCGLKCCRIRCRIPNPTCSDRCTYETCGEINHSQPWYECHSYWGGESNYGCCLFCAFNCHKGHRLVYRPAGEVNAVCDCGRNQHQKAVCTWHLTRTKPVKQPFYRCNDCFRIQDKGCCYQCAIKCHSGHNTSYLGIMDTFCSCGMEECRIRCIIPGPLKCTYESHGEGYHSPAWYECHTCWGGESDYGCCAYCAFKCHNGHKLVYHRQQTAMKICDCGRNCHQKAVCTWHLTKTEFVRQPFYRCHDCFKDPLEGCCYQCESACHAGHNTEFAGIKNAFCDCGLEECCRILCRIPHPTARCTYETCGDTYHSQPWYECRTCWGAESNYGCCLSCAFNCHKGHRLVYQPAGEVNVVCDCGRNCHQTAVCTRHSTKTEFVKQPFYRCYDCFKDPLEGCCYQCVSACHAGHNTEFAGIKNAFCDCGLEECCRILCRIPHPTDRCTYETCGDTYHSQPWYECCTCWGAESNYGCCLSCAFNCHKGHCLVYRPAGEANAVCDCGRNQHQRAVCTWHSTQEKFVKQPFYRCYDCFKDPLEGCCYQCISACHAGHNTEFAGILDAFCDCGLTCCRISCSIASPK